MKLLIRSLAVLAVLAVLRPLPATAQSVAGAWDASMETPGGVRTSRMTLQVEGEKVTGTMARPTGDVAIAGTIVGDTLRFSYTILYNDNPITLSVVALRAVDGLKGTVNLGGGANEPWWAVRAPTPEFDSRRSDP
jgi:hypothetical protein